VCRQSQNAQVSALLRKAANELRNHLSPRRESFFHCSSSSSQRELMARTRSDSAPARFFVSLRSLAKLKSSQPERLLGMLAFVLAQLLDRFFGDRRRRIISARRM